MITETIKAYDPENDKWYTWSWGYMDFYPDNLLELIKLEGLILEQDFENYQKIKNDKNNF